MDNFINDRLDKLVIIAELERELGMSNTHDIDHIQKNREIRLPIVPLHVINVLQPTCSICLQDTSERWTQTPCYHFYHEKCLREWLNRQYSCPVCKMGI